MTADGSRQKLAWPDPVRGIALLGILLNHLVEEFGPGPWFTNPRNDWPAWETRIYGVFPSGTTLPIQTIQFLGWLGDSGPGVFLFVSGLGLTWGLVTAGSGDLNPGDFFRRRVVRIFPLYLAMHGVILTLALAVPGETMTLASRTTLFSLLGVRFTDSLFFSISPSWWYVWLALQLYCAFPLLWWLMRRIGPGWFLAATWGVTVLARTWGILYSPSLYYWMTGICFATRLGEFTSGMVAAAWLARSKNEPSPRKVASWAVPAYAAGFLCSLTLPGTIVSNGLVTLGLTGLAYAAWQGILSRWSVSARAFTWMGVHAYAVFLFHQPPLHWTGAFFQGTPHVAAALAVLLLAFPVAVGIERMVDRLGGIRERINVRAVAVAILLVLSIVEPRTWNDWKHRVVAMGVGWCLAGLLVAREPAGRGVLRWWAIVAAAVALFVFPPRSGDVAVFIGFLVAVLMWLLRMAGVRAALPTAVAIIALLGVGGEVALGRWWPVEADGWGEAPALEIHPTRVYALKPNQATRLRYNQYDYVVRTNSAGLVGPVVAPERDRADTLRVLVIGDAFTMPEGVDYANSYPAILQSRLAARCWPRRVEVLDAGVTGYGPREELAQLRELGPQYRPDVVVYQFFINEFSEATLTREERLAEIGLGRSWKQRLATFLSLPQLRARVTGMKIRFVEKTTGKPHPWRSQKALLDCFRAGPNPMYAPAALETVGADLVAMQAATRNVGATLLIMFVPGAVSVTPPDKLDYFPWDQNLADPTSFDLSLPARHLHAIADPLGIPVLDLTPALKHHPVQPLYFSSSWHWNEEGHRVAAEVLSRDLERLGWLDRTVLESNTHERPHSTVDRRH